MIASPLPPLPARPGRLRRRRAALAALLAVLGALHGLAQARTPAATTADLGRLFHTPAQRAALDQARDRPAPGTGRPPAAPVAPPPSVLSVDGIVRRDDGRATVWINQQPVRAPADAGSVRVGPVRDATDGVELRIPDAGRRMRLKVGQEADADSGEVRDHYRRTPAPASHGVPVPAPGAASVPTAPPAAPPRAAGGATASSTAPPGARRDARDPMDTREPPRPGRSRASAGARRPHPTAGPEHAVRAWQGEAATAPYTRRPRPSAGAFRRVRPRRDPGRAPAATAPACREPSGCARSAAPMRASP